MKNEEKDLLIQDLCARLPYGVNIEIGVTLFKSEITNHRLKRIDFNERTINDFYIDSTSIKPYLRHLSSMTEDESAELSNIISEWFDEELFDLTEEPFLEYALSKINYSINPKLFDWLNEHHFDYRGLIEKGLALEAPKGMYENK